MAKKMCESCGTMLSKNDHYFVEREEGEEGRVFCVDCMFYPLDVLAEVYRLKTMVQMKKKIEEFNEECEDSILE